MSFKFLNVSSLQDALGHVPPTRIPIDSTTFVSYLIPPVICAILLAVLALTPNTRTFRVAVWPIMTLLAFRAAVYVDLSSGSRSLQFLNLELVRVLFSITVHSLPWTLAEKPLVRQLRPANSTPSTFMDALDLIINFRGHGWEWSRGLHVPRDTRPTNRIAFTFYTLLWAVVYGWIAGSLHLVVRTFTTSDSQGYTIFDETLPIFVQYLRASITSVLCAVLIQNSMGMYYNLFAVPCVLLLGQDPAQWPHAFDRPWCATSLTEFWGRRWHQWHRHTFIVGAYPFSAVFGRAGTIFGAFLSSAFFHYIQLVVLDSQAEIWSMFLPFLMMVPGVLAERAFYRLTGRKVCGAIGWVWTMTWLIMWGNLIVDGFVRVGLYASSNAIDDQLPLQALILKSAIAFDAWLHTM